MNTHYAWVAGFFDGEGSVGFYHGNNTSIRIQITQVDPKVLYRLTKIMQAGKVYGPYGPYRPNEQPTWQYQLNVNVAIQTFVDKIWPWLSEASKAKFNRVGIQSRRQRD